MASAQSPADSNTTVPTTETEPQPTEEQKPSNVTDEEWQAMQDILNKVYEYRTEDGHDPSKPFHRKVNKRALPSYYEVITEPVALSTIKQKIHIREYVDFKDFVRDFALIPHNAQVFNRPDAGAYQDALEIKALLEKELQQLVESNLITEQVATLPYLGEIPPQEDPPDEEEDDEDEDDEEDDEGANESDDSRGGRKRGRKRKRGSKREMGEEEDQQDADAKKRRGRPPKVDTPMEARIKNILKGMRRPKDPTGALRIFNFDRLPDKSIMPEYYEEIKSPVSVDTLKRKLKRRKYQTVDQFMQDVELMFENAKLFNKDDSQIFKDAVDLQEEARRLAAEEKAKPDSEFVMEDGRLPLPEGILHNGELYRVGDWVHIQNPNDLTKPIVSQIYRTWQDSSGQKFVNACWYYRPEQTVHRFDRHFYENEVVKTGQYRDHTVDEIVDRCFVMFHTRYNRGRPRGFPLDKEIYVCESRYNEEKHTMNKIKTWASCLPDEVREKDYEMDLFEHQKKMKKLQSPIAYLLKDEQKETSDLPKPEWGSDNAPPKIGAVHRRPRDPKESPPPEPTPSPPPPEPTPNTQKPLPRPAQYSTFAPNRTMNTNGPTPARQNSMSQAPPSYQQLPAQHGQQQSYSSAQMNHSNSNVQPNGYPANATQSHLAARPASSDNTTSQQYRPSSSSMHYSTAPNYKAPNPVEVYKLSEQANATIPLDIREQFQRDENGCVLFFTAPPLSNESMDEAQENGSPGLAHSVPYLAAKAKRDEIRRQKRKRDELEETNSRKVRAKAARTEQQTFEAKVKSTTDRALSILEQRLAEDAREEYKHLFGDSWAENTSERLEKLKRDQAATTTFRRESEMKREQRKRALSGYG